MTQTRERTTWAERQRVANIIKDQVEWGVWASLGAHNFQPTETNFNPALQATVKILPYRKDGKRSTRGRLMTLVIQLTPQDLYAIEVYYQQHNRMTDRYERVDHFYAGGIYADQLSRILLSLDSDNDREV